MNQASHQSDPQERNPVSIVPGVILLSASLLEVFGMLHHPTVHAAEISDAVEQIARGAALSGVVHGALIALMLLIAYGFIDFSVRRGLRRPLIRAGALGYARQNSQRGADRPHRGWQDFCIPHRGSHPDPHRRVRRGRNLAA